MPETQHRTRPAVLADFARAERDARERVQPRRIGRVSRVVAHTEDDGDCDVWPCEVSGGDPGCLPEGEEPACR